MIAIVTGATSFLGSSLCYHLAENGYKVYAVVRDNSANMLRLPCHSSISIIKADLSAIDSIIPAIKAADLFFHFAWEGLGKQGRHDLDMQDRNIHNTFTAIRTASALQCKCFVFAGTQAEYGIVKGVMSEETICNPVTEYGKAKFRVGREGSKLANSLGMKYLHLRIFSVYGENDHKDRLPIQSVTNMLAGKDIDTTEGKQLWNYLYIDDASRQIILLAENIINNNEMSCIYNVASKDTRPLKDFLEEIRRVTCSEIIIKYGAIDSGNALSISPNVIKTENAIGFIQDVSFEQGIKNIIKHITQ